MALKWRAFLDDLESTFADTEDPEDAGARDLTGFENRTDSTLAMDGNDLEISPAVTSFTFWENGVSYTKSATEGVTITSDDDLSYVYYTGGVLTVSTTVWDLTGTAAPVAMVYKEGSNYVIFDERHGHNRDRNWHEWAHDTVGCSWESGFGSTFDNTTMSVGNGVVHDEDLDHTPAMTMTVCRLWYRAVGAGSMEWEDNISTPYKAAAGVIQYDNAGTLTNVDNAKHVQSWVYMTNSTDYPIAIVVGQAQYATVALARNDGVPTIPTMETREWKLLYSVLYKNVGGTPTYVEQVDYREVATGPGSAYSPAVHADLSGRDAASSHPATSIETDATNFDDILSTETTVQAALDALDDGAVNAAGDTMTGDLIMSNDEAYQAKESGGTVRDLLKIGTNERVRLNGGAANRVYIYTSDLLYIMNGPIIINDYGDGLRLRDSSNNSRRVVRMNVADAVLGNVDLVAGMQCRVRAADYTALEYATSTSDCYFRGWLSGAAAAPTTTELPNDHDFCIWEDTGTNVLTLHANDGGTIRQVS
jgi:hypothetical protein